MIHVKRSQFGIRIFQCECGHVLYATKKLSGMTKNGHLKNMYCPYCKVENNKVQVGRLM